MSELTTTDKFNFLNFNNIDDALRVGKIISDSPFCPSWLRNKPSDIIVAIQFGSELGFKPLQSLHNICVINGKPSIYGDGMLAACKASPDFEYIKEYFENTPEGLTACCEIKKRGEPRHLVMFSEFDADMAGLLDKAGPWKTNKKRMLQMRARGFGLRDVFPHVLRGFISAEEAQDYPTKNEEKTIGERKIAPVEARNMTATITQHSGVTYTPTVISITPIPNSNPIIAQEENLPVQDDLTVDKQTGEIIYGPTEEDLKNDMINNIKSLIPKSGVTDKQLRDFYAKAAVNSIEELTGEKREKLFKYLMDKSIKLKKEKTNV